MKYFVLLLALLAGAAPAQTPPFVPPPGPVCLPANGNLHTLLNPSTGNTILLLWCDIPAGTYHYAVGGNSANWMQAQCLTTIEPFTPSVGWVQHAWRACVTSLMGASDQAYANQLSYLWVPRPTINGTGPRTVFTLNADGSIGPQLSLGGVLQTIPGGKVTSGLRVPGGAAKRFCDVSGMTSDQGQSLPAKSYATCTLRYPPATGWGFPASPSGASLQPPTEAYLVDAASNRWAVDANGRVTVNGIEDASTANVIKLQVVGALIWQKNASNLWWSKAAPTASWLPSAGTPTAPL